MSEDTQEIVQKLDELSGTIAALVAVVAAHPGLTHIALKDAKGLFLSLTPGPINHAASAVAPIYSAMRALDQISSISRVLAAARLPRRG
jgi:hypothetical protein